MVSAMSAEQSQNEVGQKRTPAEGRDRIVAACFGLQWMASQVETVANHMAMVPDQAVLATTAGEHRRYLDRVADELAAIVEDLGDYCNGVDIVTEEDEVLLGPVFALLHGEELTAAEPAMEE
jgi:hypothetical protein